MIPGIFAGAAGAGSSPPTGYGYLFDLSDHHADVIIGGGGSTASTQAGTGSSFRYARCRASDAKNSGAWLIEFVLSTYNTSSCSVDFGADRIGYTPQAAYPGMYAGSYFSRPSSALARFYLSGASSPSFVNLSTPADIVGASDVVGIAINFATEEVKAYKNGVLVTAQTVAGIDTGSEVYVPCVKLSGSSGNPTLVTIPSSVQYPISGYEPWA